MATNGAARDHPIKKVIIVGAGPSGLILALLLSRADPPIQVTLLEAADDLDTNPRAAHYAPSACYELNRAGVLEDVRREGFHPDSVCWRKPDGTLLGGLGWKADEVKIESGPMVCLPLDRLDRLLLRHLLTYETAKVFFKHKVLTLDQDESQARVQVEISEPSSSRTEWMSADYIIGADGANSIVRRSLFGDMNYPGETLQHQIIATNVYYDFHKFGYWDSNFIVTEKDWYMAAKITRDGLWRVTYGDEWGLSNEEYMKRQPMRYEKILPGNPKPGDYKLASASPYKLHQRCSPSFRVGRVLLVADAAHLCNPFGGLGLTGGIADVGSLYDALMHVQHGRCDESVLDEYSRVRIQKWKETIDPMSRKNFDLIWNPGEEAEKNRDEFWGFCKLAPGPLDIRLLSSEMLLTSFAGEKMKTDKTLAQAMANSTHGLRENFDAYVKAWQDGQRQNGSANGEVNGNGELGKAGGLKAEHVETIPGKGDTKTKTKILGYGTSVAVD